jgi:hypothetical protein
MQCIVKALKISSPPFWKYLSPVRLVLSTSWILICSSPQSIFWPGLRGLLCLWAGVVLEHESHVCNPVMLALGTPLLCVWLKSELFAPFSVAWVVESFSCPQALTCVPHVSILFLCSSRGWLPSQPWVRCPKACLSCSCASGDRSHLCSPHRGQDTRSNYTQR